MKKYLSITFCLDRFTDVKKISKKLFCLQFNLPFWILLLWQYPFSSFNALGMKKMFKNRILGSFSKF